MFLPSIYTKKLDVINMSKMFIDFVVYFRHRRSLIIDFYRNMKEIFIHCKPLIFYNVVRKLTFNFSIASALLVVAPPLSNAFGRASTAVSVTDLTGDGALLSGNGGAGGTASYLAQYNGFVPGGTPFADLLPSASAGPWLMQTTTDAYPASGYVPVAGTVHNMSSMVTFTLSANDMASGTNFFEIIPEPGTALLTLVVLALRRR